MLVAADITSYGGRMVIAILPVVLVTAFRLLFANEIPRSSGRSSPAVPISAPNPIVDEARPAPMVL